MSKSLLKSSALIFLFFSQFKYILEFVRLLQLAHPFALLLDEAANN